ncbi:MAG: phosphoribosylanthranilate isomerase [Ignavibacteria bacterium]
MKVKICGITNIDDALLCEKLGADALGFIFYKQSRRNIQHEAAKSIIGRLSSFTFKVGVFVNEQAEFINHTASEIKLNAVQLHGEEIPEFISEIELPVIKAFRISGNFSYSALSLYENAACLLDSYSPDAFGGTGRSFDWEKIPFRLREKIILSGGVSSENIEYIFKEIKPRAVDLSSSIEKEPGWKDEKKASEFFKKINSLRR